MRVKVLETDEKGRVKLSMKALLDREQRRRSEHAAAASGATRDAAQRRDCAIAHEERSRSRRPARPEVLRLGSSGPTPVAGRRARLLIRVAASGVNRPDVLQRKGLYPVPPGASDLPGLEVAGDDRRRRRRRRWPRPASRSATASARWSPAAATPSCASRRSASACRCRQGLSDVEAASLPETFFTVWTNVFDRARLQPGETLLVQGGTSGIGVTAIQMAKALGRDGDRHRRQRRQVRGLPRARRRPRDQLQDAGLRRRGASASPAARASTSSSTWSPATTSRAKCSAWPRTAGSSSSRCRAASKREFDAGLVLRKRLVDHRLDAAAAAGRVQGGDRRGAARHGLAVARSRARQAGDPPGLPGRRGGRRRTR